MSDIGIEFPIWMFVAFALTYALPLTTIVLASLVFVGCRCADAAPSGRCVSLQPC